MKPRTLKIANFLITNYSMNCFCGKPTDLKVKLTGKHSGGQYCPVCKSCLKDRLSTPYQGFYQKPGEEVFFQSFYNGGELFLVRRIKLGQVDYSVSFQPEGIEEPCAVITLIKGEQSARKALRALSAVEVDWKGIFKEGKNHPQYWIARDLAWKYKEELSI